MGYKQNISSNLINQVIKIAFGLFTGIITARALGPEGQGYASYIILIFTLVGTFGHLGLNNAVMYFQKRTDYSYEQVFRVNLSYLYILFAVISLGVLVLYSCGAGLGDYNIFYILGGLVFVLSFFVFVHCHSFFVGDEKIIESNRYNIYVFFLKSILITGFWILGYLSPGSFFAITVLAMALNALYLYAKLGLKFEFTHDWSLLSGEFKYGSIVFLSTLFGFLHYKADQFMIKQMLGVSELGIYTIAVTIAELMFLIPASITTALTGKLYNTTIHSQIRTITARTVKITLYVCGILSLAGLLLAHLIPFVYGQAYVRSVPATMILMLGVVFASVGRVAFPYFYTLGRPLNNIVISFGTLLINISLNFVLIPKYGIYGAAIASSISYFIYGVYYLVSFIALEGFSVRSLLVLDREDFALLIKPDKTI